MNIIIPGLYNSDENHWLTIWENENPVEFFRVMQSDWENPVCCEWTNRIEEALKKFNYADLIVIGHVDKPGYPKYITGFSPMPENKLPFPSIVVASSNDHVVELERARLFAKNWGSEFIELQNAGHIERKSGFGKWDFGFELISRLKERTT